MKYGVTYFHEICIYQYILFAFLFSLEGKMKSPIRSASRMIAWVNLSQINGLDILRGGGDNW